MITLIAKLVAKPGQETNLKRECLEIAAQVRENEPNCTMYIPHVDPKNPAIIVFVEKYANQDALDNHLKTPYFQNLAGKFDELLASPLELQILSDLE